MINPSSAGNESGASEIAGLSNGTAEMDNVRAGEAARKADFEGVHAKKLRLRKTSFTKPTSPDKMRRDYDGA